jgi:hypothetical protein
LDLLEARGISFNSNETIDLLLYYRSMEKGEIH